MSLPLLNVVNLVRLADDPADGQQGDMYFNTTLAAPRFHDGTDWQTFGGGGLTQEEVEALMPKTLVLKSDSTAVQNLTTSFVTMKQADNATDSEATPENGKTYEIEVVWVCDKTADTAAPYADFEVRAGATVLGRSVGTADSTGVIWSQLGVAAHQGRIGLHDANAYRAACRCGSFVSDGTPVKFYVKASVTTDTPRLLRDGTYVLLREL